MADFTFFTVPDGDWQHLPTAPEPTIFTLDEAVYALRGGLTLGEDLSYGGSFPGSGGTFAYGYMTLTLWKPAPDCCSFCGKPQELPTRRLAAGRGGLRICSECAELVDRVLNRDPPMTGPSGKPPHSRS